MAVRVTIDAIPRRDPMKKIFTTLCILLGLGASLQPHFLDGAAPSVLVQVDDSPTSETYINPYNPSALIEGTQTGYAVALIGGTLLLAGTIAGIIIATTGSGSGHSSHNH